MLYQYENRIRRAVEEAIYVRGHEISVETIERILVQVVTDTAKKVVKQREVDRAFVPDTEADERIG